MPIPSGGLIHKYDLLDPACYPGSGTTINDLVGSLDLSITGSPTYNSVNGSLTWNANGVGAYSALGSYVNTTGTFTVSLWVKINDATVSQLLFNNGDRAGSMSGYSSFFDGAGSDLFDFGGNNVWGMASGSTLSQDQWYNLTYTLDNGISQAKIYINGVLSSTSTNGLGNAYGVNAFLALGGYGSSTGSPTLDNKASYGVVLFYNSVLNATQVGDIYNTYNLRFNPPTPNYASFDFSNPLSYPGTGNTIYDLTPLNNDLTNTTGLAGTFGGTGQSKYYSFVGGTDQFYKANCSSDGFVAGKLYTASEFLWVRSSNWVDTGNLCLAGWGDDIGVGGGQLGIWKNFASSGPGLIAMMGSGVGLVEYPTNPTDNEWHHLGYVADGSGCTVYLDGTAVGTVPQNFYFPSGTGATGYVAIQIPISPFMALGGLYSNYYPAGGFDLAIAEFYNTALDGTEVNALYNSQVSRFVIPPPTPEVFEFDFSSTSYPGSGTTVYDLSGNGNDFTLAGSAYSYDPVFGGGSLFLSFTSALTRSSLSNFSYGTSALSVNMWIYQTDAGTSNYNMFFQLADTGGSGPAGNTFYLVNQTGGQNISGQFNGPVVNTSYDLPLNQWKMLTVTIPANDDGTGTKIYVDGTDVTTTVSSPAAFNFDNTTPTTINGGAATFGFWKNQFYIGEMQFQNTELTPVQVLAKYNATEARYNPTPPTPSNGVGGRTFGQGFAG